MKKGHLLAATLVTSAALLAGCGGGGGGGSDSPSTPPPANAAEGVYEGDISNGLEHNTLVLENGQYYSLYGETINNVFYVYGFIQGTGTANNGSFSSTDLRDYVSSGEVVSGILSASYTPDVSFNGSIKEGSSTVTFTGAPLQGATYNYKTSANLSNIVGAWNMTSLQGEAVTLNIGSSGSFTGSSGGCSFSGTLAPRSTGKNVFNVSLTFGGSPCLLPGQSASGIALEYMLPTSRRQFIIAGTNAARTSGTAFLGSR